MHRGQVEGELRKYACHVRKPLNTLEVTVKDQESIVRLNALDGRMLKNLLI